LRNLQKNPSWRSIIVGGILADGSALWEEVQPKEQLLQELQNDILMGCAEVFYSEVLNDPQCGSGQWFDLSKLPKYKTNPEINFLVGKFIIIDPSLGKKKSDAQVVKVVEVWDGVPEIAQIHIKQVPAPELVKWVLQLAVRERIPLIVAEAVAYQGTLLQWFSKVCQDEHIEGIAFESVAPGGRHKNNRILKYLKSLMAGLVVVQPQCLPITLSQIATFDPLKTNNTDDVLDTGAYVEDVMLMYPEKLMLSSVYTLELGSGYTVENNNCVF
jgi:hypothetical protein